MGETLSRCANDLRLPQHRSSHSDLMPYADLMLWLKGANYESFLKLSKVSVHTYKTTNSHTYNYSLIITYWNRLLAHKVCKETFSKE